MELLNMPVAITEREYRYLLKEIEKYRSIAARTTVPIIVHHDKYCEVIGQTDLIVAAELFALKAENERLKARIAELEGK